MVQLQIISKVLQSASNQIVDEYMLNDEYFSQYKEEFNFIQEHYKKYGNIPDVATFLDKFPTVELVEVTESDKYLIDKVREEYLFEKSVPALKKYADLLNTDSNAASEYMASMLPQLQPSYDLGGVDIIAQGQERYNKYLERKDNPSNAFFESGFKEIDEELGGIQREEEFFVIVARTNQGKSWILEKITSHIWQLGFNVGYLSPEMTANSIGFRFDTLYNHYSNRGLVRGNDDINDVEYKEYLDTLATNTNKFIVSTPLDFDRKVTVTKLKNWIKQYKLDMIAIDGITYLDDERYRRGDNKNITLTNISEDLMSLSVEMKIPVVVVVQANRTGVVQDDDGTPDLESIRDSDGIGFNASTVWAIRQKKDNVLEIGIKKARTNMRGQKYNYSWDINTGDFQWIPSTETDNESFSRERKEKVHREVDNTRKQYNSKADVF